MGRHRPQQEVVGAFFDALGPERAARLAFVSADGADWIRIVVAERAPDAVVCLDTFHLVSWATGAVDEGRRTEWNTLRAAGAAHAAKQFKGLRWVLLRNWENLSGRQKGVIRDLEQANRRMFRAWQLAPPGRSKNVFGKRGRRRFPRFRGVVGDAGYGYLDWK